MITAIGAGTVTLTATSAGDTDYDAASTSQLITIGKTTPTLTITSVNTLSVDGTLTATITTSATGGRGGAITFAIVGGSGSATVDGNSGLITAIGAGTVTLTATSAGDTDYNAASTSQLITIGKTTPTLAITSANILSVYGTLTATVTTSATGGRGGAITFAIVGGSGSATVDVNSGLITAIVVGTVTLTAISAGDTNYYPASTSQLITIGKTTPTLAITSANILNVYGTLTATVTTSATGGRGGAITFAISGGSGSATIDGNSGFITAIGAGTVTLTATSAGDTDYDVASTSQLITIGKSGQVLTITSSNMMVVDGSLAASVISTAGNGGTATYSIENGTGSALVNASTGLIQAIMHGTVTLMATTAGNSTYAPASTSQLITISKGSPTLMFTSSDKMLVGQTLTATVNTTATYGRGGAKIYSILGGSGSATVNSSTGLIYAVGSGTVTLMVSSAGDADYNPSSSSQLLTISNDVGVVPEDLFKVLISKAVSLNGDGLGDKFVIKRIENYPENEVVIVDKGGKIVFKAHGYNNETIVFDGQSNDGAPVVDGTYYYRIILYDNGVVNRFMGYFKLKR